MVKKGERLTRIVRLLRMLLAGRGYKMTELAELFGVVRRTVARDLALMRKAGVPVELDFKRDRYYVRSGNFGLSELTVEEALSVWALANSIGLQPHIPFYDSLRAAVEKVRQALPATTRRKLARMSKGIDFMPLKLANLEGKSAEYQMIVEAIANRRALQLIYSSPAKLEPITARVRPYKLVFSEHSWYLIGRSSEHSEIRIFNLLRIESLELTRERFSIPKNFNWERYIGNAWGMAPESVNTKVVIKFKPPVAPNVAQVKWHKTQQTHFNADGSLIFRVTVSGLDEISWWILRYGEHAEVVTPAKLRRLVVTRLLSMTELYASDIDLLNAAD
jgi:predicted DNA-binding transcriptional regulator YafY